ncbi:MAG: hypothetical protein ACFB10_03975 [Salibacteraceae bacterium]
MPFHGSEWIYFWLVVAAISYVIAKVNTRRGYGNFWRMLIMASIGVTGIGLLFSKVFAALFNF